MDIATLGIKVESSAVRTAASDFDRFVQSGRRAEAGAKSVERSFATVSRAASLLKGAFAGLSVGLIAREYIQLSDQFATLNARLRLVTGSAQEYARAQSALFDIANRTRTDIQGTADLYVSLSNSTQALGVSQEEVLGVTETINQALQVSGANAQAAAAALTQLGQGFASGVLRGEELNSVLEQAPRLAQAIADGLGVPLGKLRELGQQGELTGQRVFRAVQKSGEQVAKEFGLLPLTVGQASTEVRNSVLELIGAFDQASGASGGLASLISDVADGIRNLAAEVRRLQADGSIARWADEVRFAMEGAADGAEVLTAALDVMNKFAIAAGTVQRNSVLWMFSAEARKEIEDTKRAFQESLANMNRAREKFASRETQPRAGQAQDDPLPLLDRPKGGAGGGSSGKGSSRIPETERYLEQLRRQIGSVYELTAAQQLEYDIREGMLKLDGKISRERLLAVAQELDAIRSRKAAEEEAARDRQEADRDAARAIIDSLSENKRARDQLVESAQRETAEIGSNNEALREEIELIGANAQMRSVIEQARISSAIAIKEEALALADLNALSEEERQALRDQILLLRERIGLINEKGIREALQEDLKAQQEFVKNAAENIQRYLGESLFDVMNGEFENIGDAFADMLKRMVAEALAADVSKYLLGDLVTGGSGKGVFGGFLASIFGGGRASGGPVSGGMVYEVGEMNRPELLSAGGKSYLIPGNDGNVTPVAGGVSIVQNINVSGGASRGEVMTAMQVAKEQAKREVMESMRRGGAFA